MTAPAAPLQESKQERKARLKEEKAAAKLAKAEAKAQAKADKKAAKLAAKEAKAQAKADKKAGKPAKAAETAPAKASKDFGEQWERYNQLRGNVRRRRALYVIIILLAIGVFLGTAWDIVYNASEFKLYFFGAYGLLFLWGLLLLFSRKRHLQEVRELEAMHRTYLECEACNSVFQFGELRLHDRKSVGFSCPVCSEESALPGTSAIPVERVLPEAGVLETSYACGNCNEQIVLGTFGATPRETRFRACPSCGISGQVGLA